MKVAASWIYAHKDSLVFQGAFGFPLGEVGRRRRKMCALMSVSLPRPPRHSAGMRKLQEAVSPRLIAAEMMCACGVPLAFVDLMGRMCFVL